MVIYMSDRIQHFRLFLFVGTTAVEELFLIESHHIGFTVECCVQVEKDMGISI